jgi:hypothetical protein
VLCSTTLFALAQSQAASMVLVGDNEAEMIHVAESGGVSQFFMALIAP